MSTPNIENTESDNRDELEQESVETTDRAFLDQTLRPHKWDEYIGQANLKEN